jgi:hypothetical protein
MFKLQPSPTFTTKVKVPIPGGKSEFIEVQFRHKTRTDLQAYLERAAKSRDEAEVDALMEIVAGWSGIECEFSRENLALLMDNFPASGPAILAAYARELTDARLGN